MSWSITDDEKIQECRDRLMIKYKELQSQLKPTEVIINNITQIQSRDVISYNDKREKITTKVIPKDKWNEDMTDKYRLKIKDECISRTNELLGEENG